MQSAMNFTSPKTPRPASISTARVAPSSMVSTPRSFARKFIWARSSGSLRPQLVPRRPSVSYSTGETTSLPLASAYTLLHWISSPGMQASVSSPALGALGRPAVLIAEGDAREQALVFAHGTAQRDGDLLAVLLVQHLLGLEIALAQVRRGVVEVDGAVLLEVDDGPAGGRPVQRESGDLQLAQAIAEAAAAVGLLDAARERALTAHARTVGVGEARAGEGAGREDERVGGRQRVDSGRAQLEQRLGDQVTPGPDDLLAVQLAPGDRAASQVDVVVGPHATLPVFVRLCPDSESKPMATWCQIAREGAASVV